MGDSKGQSREKWNGKKKKKNRNKKRRKIRKETDDRYIENSIRMGDLG